MSKLKLLSTLSLGILIPSISSALAISCSNNNTPAIWNNGQIAFNTKNELNSWLSSTDYVVNSDISVTNNNLSSVTNFLNSNVKAIHITRGIAKVLSTTLPEVLQAELTESGFQYVTKDNESITVTAALLFEEMTLPIYVVHTFTKVNNSLFDKMTGKRNGVVVQDNITLSGQISVANNYLELGYLNKDQETVQVHMLASDFPKLKINQ